MLAIALVVASGVAVLVMSLTVLEALNATASAYYDRYRFADVFAGVKRAPDRLAKSIAAHRWRADRRNQDRPVRDPRYRGLRGAGGRHSSSRSRSGREPHLNRLALRVPGRLVEPGRADEIVISEAFRRRPTASRLAIVSRP